MFIKFNDILFNTSQVIKIERIKLESEEEVRYAIKMSTSLGEIIEHQKSKESMNKRFSDISDHVGATTLRGDC